MEGGIGCFGYIVGIGFVIGLILWLIYWAIKIGLIILVLLLGIIIIGIIPVLISWIFYKTFQALKRNEFEQTRAIILPCLTLLTGASIASLKLGLISSPLIIGALVAGGVPLITLLLYPPLNRRRLIKKYQEGEKHLIAP